MIIARKGNFSLNTKTFICDHVNTTHELGICKWEKNGEGEDYCYTVADFNKDGELVSCCNRLLHSIETKEDLSSVKVLEEIGYLIITETDNSVM